MFNQTYNNMKKLILLIVLFIGVVRISNEATIDNQILMPTEIVQPENAQFHIAYKIVLEHEGYYSNHSKDRGRETYSGITRKYNKDWNGWERLDRYKRSTGKIKWNQKIDELDSLVMNFYLGIWIDEGFHELRSQKIANYVFDFRINSPVGMKIVQRSLNDLGYNVPLTRKLDKATINALNDVNEEEFFEVMVGRRVRFYTNIVKNDKSQKGFLNHWLKRAKTIDG